MEIQIHPNSSLGDEPAVMEQLEFGGIDFTRFSLATLADMFPKLNLLQMPYLYKDSEHMWKVLDGELGDMFMAELDDSPFVPPLSGTMQGPAPSIPPAGLLRVWKT